MYGQRAWIAKKLLAQGCSAMVNFLRLSPDFFSRTPSMLMSGRLDAWQVRTPRRVALEFNSGYCASSRKGISSMKLSEVVPKEKVARACENLGIRDWSNVKEVLVSADEAKVISDEIGGEACLLALEDFREGLQVELEHGTRYSEANITNNHPVLTGMIVLAHLKESLLYYKRLAVVELEGDLLKATKLNDTGHMRTLYERLVKARLALNTAEARFLGVG
jgi:hypothetical protein